MPGRGQHKSSSRSSNKTSARSPPTQKETEREFHNRLDFEERAQASDYLASLHESVDAQLESAAKRALLQVDGDTMVETEDNLTSKLILSARDPSTVNPSQPSDLVTPDPARLNKLIRALRSRCQALADGGTRFHKVFDSLDASDSGEISGVSAVLRGLQELGIKQVNREDAKALLEEFEGSEPDRMSYRKVRPVKDGEANKSHPASNLTINPSVPQGGDARELRKRACSYHYRQPSVAAGSC